ncbi:WG repeat-containing protein [Marivirga tractuosa]|uniref:WG repeat-containing protein n=1 Tax=Marivirga tractuosa TaxID=1006 RepID=UPI0035CF2FB4
MKNILLLLLLMAHTFSSYSQQDKSWTAFYDKDSGLMGFKDSSGDVKIKPKFMGFTVAKKFDDIIAVMEQKEDEYVSYHLTKAGKIVGRDSLFISDNSADCENEGFIRFQDHKTGNTGMLNSKGEVVIPAEYNALSQARNGYIIALKGAKKSFWDKKKHSGCNHFSWKGGQTFLLDTANQMIIEDFKNESVLDFYSLDIIEKKVDDPNREVYKAKNDKYYSFIAFKKTFENWLDNEVLDSLSREQLLAATYDSIYFWIDNSGWLTHPKDYFIDQHYDLLKSRLLAIRKEGADYFISVDGLNPYNFETSEFDQYFNNCSEAKYWKYPLMTLVISHGKGEDYFQDHISFLKTEEGYQLIQLTLRNTEE